MVQQTESFDYNQQPKGAGSCPPQLPAGLGFLRLADYTFT